MNRTKKNANRLLNKLESGDETKKVYHEFEIYNFDSQVFSHLPKVDWNKRTLLLIPGTFSSVEGSFGKMDIAFELLRPYYDQIIGFNHSTVHDNYQANVSSFIELIQTKYVDTGVQYIDVMGSSRGGMLAFYIAQSIPSVRNIITLGSPLAGSDLVKLINARKLKQLLSSVKGLAWFTRFRLKLAISVNKKFIQYISEADGLQCQILYKRNLYINPRPRHVLHIVGIFDPDELSDLLVGVKGGLLSQYRNLRLNIMKILKIKAVRLFSVKDVAEALDVIIDNIPSITKEIFEDDTNDLVVSTTSQAYTPLKDGIINDPKQIITLSQSFYSCIHGHYTTDPYIQRQIADQIIEINDYQPS